MQFGVSEDKFISTVTPLNGLHLCPPEVIVNFTPEIVEFAERIPAPEEKRHHVALKNWKISKSSTLQHKF